MSVANANTDRFKQGARELHEVYIPLWQTYFGKLFSSAWINVYVFIYKI